MLVRGIVHALAAAMRRGAAIAVVAAMTVATGGGNARAYSPDYEAADSVDSGDYRVGILPHHNPRNLLVTYKRLFDLINARLNGPRLRIVASRDYRTFTSRLSHRVFHLAFVNSFELVQYAEDAGYTPFAKWDDDSQFSGICLVRKDGAIRDVADLRGQSVAYPAPSALAGTMLPMGYLYEHGVHPHRDATARYVGSLESPILSVYLRRTAAGCTSLRPWSKFAKEFPERAADLTVLFQTHSLPRIGIIARDDVPADVVARVRDIMLSLDQSEEGRQALADIPIARFVPATADTFVPTRAFVRWFSDHIHRAGEP